MKKVFQEVPFRSFILLGLTVNLVFAVPILGFLISFNIIDPLLGLLLFIPFSLFTVPIGASFCWLIAKGSNWENSFTAIKVMGVFMGQPYVFLLAGLMGFRLFGTTGGIVISVIFYIAGGVLGYYLSIFVAKRYFQIGI